MNGESASGSENELDLTVGRSASSRIGPQVLGKSGDAALGDLPGDELELKKAAPADVAGKPKGHLCGARLRRFCHFSVKLVGTCGLMLILLMATLGWPAGLVYNENIRSHVMSIMFLIGLLIVALEDVIGINKSAIMLLLAATMWTMLAVGFDPTESEAGAHQLHHELNRGLRDVGSVILFLLPAMGVVESIDHFDGFQIVTVAMKAAMAGRKERLMPIICILTFFLSSVIDNLTSTIVALKILRRVVPHEDDFRRELGGLAVIAANAGGAWSPIGDVTTTMLWIQGKITAPRTVTGLFFPSLVSGLLPLLGVCWAKRRRIETGKEIIIPDPRGGLPNYARSPPSSPSNRRSPPRRTNLQTPSNLEGDEDLETPASELEAAPLRSEFGVDLPDDAITSTKVLALSIGIFVILLVPILKMWTGLPPYLGMLLALGIMWLLSDLLQFDQSPGNEKGHDLAPRGVIAALYNVDLTGLLFFTGVLLSVGALDSAGVLHEYATMLVNRTGHSPVALCTLLGISSAVVDNVPLVEASIDMFEDVGPDDRLWQLLALAAGTGGSILSVGSIAGVTLMSMEGVAFLWYCRRISLWAFVGFILGVLAYQAQHAITGD